MSGVMRLMVKLMMMKLSVDSSMIFCSIGMFWFVMVCLVRWLMLVWLNIVLVMIVFLMSFLNSMLVIVRVGMVVLWVMECVSIYSGGVFFVWIIVMNGCVCI